MREGDMETVHIFGVHRVFPAPAQCNSGSSRRMFAVAVFNPIAEGRNDVPLS